MKNHLAGEKSPYLKQHQSNPVWWYPWGSEAFEKAKRENKPILLSIGYSTCHWCHVMEHESFTQQDVADVLNRDFVAIKVDREERPDVDSLYMNILVGLNGHGGWPMNMMLSPDREAFFGGTYYPKAHFLNLLSEISRVWNEAPEQIHGTARRITEWLKTKDRDAGGGALSPMLLTDFYDRFLADFDFVEGGRKGAPKFVPAYALRLLLRYHLREPSSRALEMVEKTLEKISRAGIYDHLGGAFHRYATDSRWLIPHFEKMLYDQAAMAQLYLEAFSVTREDEYRIVLEETFEYVMRDLASPEGAFFSAEDADSEGEEGTFYIWKYEEIQTLLTQEEFLAFSDTYAISPEGNFEEKNILELKDKQSRKNFSALVLSAQEKLFAKRLSRPRPLRDEKILVSWNAMMISALAKSGAFLNKTFYIVAAERATEFILDRVRGENGELHHQFIDGEASKAGTLDDYSFLIDALIELYQATFKEKYLLDAMNLQKTQNRLFLNDGDYFNNDGRDIYLIKREKSFMDNVTPSGNSVTVFNLLRLADFFFDLDLRESALFLLMKFPKELQSFPTEFVQALMAYDYILSKPRQIAIIAGSDRSAAEDLVTVARRRFAPNQIIAALFQNEDGTARTQIPLLEDRQTLGGNATAYVCFDHACQEPVTSLD